MSQSVRRPSLSLLVVLGMLFSVLLVLAPTDSASAATTGKVRGNIAGTQSGAPKVKVKWFTSDWKYIGARKAYNGVYYLTLPPGTYWLQFTDQRPTYDVTKYAPTDVKVRVRANHTIVKNVRMHRGAAITGTAKAGGKAAKGAKIVAANASEQSYTTTANKQGQFALGGLPAGSYSVFTYDKQARWVGKSTYVSNIKPGSGANIAIKLTKKAGGLLVDLYAGPDPIKKKIFVTAVSKKTGQFWTARASHGSVAFAGLFPGRYKLVAPGTGNYLARTGAVKRGRVKPGRTAFGSFRLNKHGAWVDGIVVDYEDPSYPLKGAQVLLFDAKGNQLGSTSSNSNGHFHFGGQLTSQSGMTVVAGPGQYSDYLGQGTHYCKYGKGTSDKFAVVTSRGTDIGAVELPHLPAEEQDGFQCYPSDGS